MKAILVEVKKDFTVDGPNNYRTIELSDEEMLNNLERNLKFQIRNGSLKVLRRKRKNTENLDELLDIDVYMMQLSNQHANYISRSYLSPKIIAKNRKAGLLGPIKQVTEIENFGMLKHSFGTTFERPDGKKGIVNLTYLYDKSRPKKVRI